MRTASLSIQRSKDPFTSSSTVIHTLQHSKASNPHHHKQRAAAKPSPLPPFSLSLYNQNSRGYGFLSNRCAVQARPQGCRQFRAGPPRFRRCHHPYREAHYSCSGWKVSNNRDTHEDQTRPDRDRGISNLFSFFFLISDHLSEVRWTHNHNHSRSVSPICSPDLFSVLSSVPSRLHSDRCDSTGYYRIPWDAMRHTMPMS